MTANRQSKKLNIFRVLILIGFFLIFQVPSTAQQSNRIQFQSRIVNTDGTRVNSTTTPCVIAGPNNDTCDFRVRIWNVSSGGSETPGNNLMYEELHQNVEIGETDGIFQIFINSVCNATPNADHQWSYTVATPLVCNIIDDNDTGTIPGINFDRDDLWLEISFAPSGTWTNLASPPVGIETFNRTRLTSTTAAFTAQALSDGYTSEDFVQLAPGTTQNTTKDLSLINISTTANTTNPLILINEDGAGNPDLIDFRVAGETVFDLNNIGSMTVGKDVLSLVGPGYEDLATGYIYSFQREVQITNPGAPLTNYDVLIELDTASLISLGQLQSDCDDIIFSSSQTLIDTTTKLNYWVEQGCNTDRTQIWVNVTTVPNGVSYIYLHHGNPAVSIQGLNFAGNFYTITQGACQTGATQVNTYNGRYIRGGTTFGSLGGTASHTHTVDAFIADFFAGGFPAHTGAPNANLYGVTHGHFFFATSSSVSNLPSYIDTRLCSYSSTLPILDNLQNIFFPSAVPTGWTHDSVYNNRLIRLNITAGATGGSDNHTHTVSGNSSGTGGYGGPGIQTIIGSTPIYTDNHYHVLSGTTSTDTLLPPYLNIRLIKPSSTAVLPVNSIMMFSSAPPLGWNNYSVILTRFPRGSTTPGGTAGTTTHNHGGTMTLNVGTSLNPEYFNDFCGFGVPPCGYSSAAHTHAPVSGSVTTANHTPLYVDLLFYQRKAPVVTVTPLSLSSVGSQIGDSTNKFVDIFVKYNRTQRLYFEDKVIEGVDGNLNFNVTTNTVFQINNEGDIVMPTGGTKNIVNTSGNNLVQIRDIAQNFGATFEAGAVVSRNSYLGEEFQRERTTVTDSQVLTWGDNGAWTVHEQANGTFDCTFGVRDDTINGIFVAGSIQVNAGCMIYLGGTTLGTLHTIFNAANLPLFIYKISPNGADTNKHVRAGLMDTTTFAAADPPNGIFFTNNGGNTWTGRTVTTSTPTNVVCTGQTINTTQYALIKAEMPSPTEVRFYVDPDVSNGISWHYCGSSTTNIPTANLAPAVAWKSNVAWAGAGSFVNIDYMRIWQDDAAETTNEETQNIELQTYEEELIPQNPELETQEQTEEEVIIQNIAKATGLKFQNLEDIQTINLTPTLTNTTIKIDIEEIKQLGNLIVAGTVIVEGDIKIKGDIRVEGNLILGEDSFGQIQIPEGEKEIEVIFQKEKPTEPHVVVQPVGKTNVIYSVEEVTKTGFKIKIKDEATKPIAFSWFAVNMLVE